MLSLAKSRIFQSSLSNNSFYAWFTLVQLGLFDKQEREHEKSHVLTSVK